MLSDIFHSYIPAMDIMPGAHSVQVVNMLVLQILKTLIKVIVTESFFLPTRHAWAGVFCFLDRCHQLLDR